MKSKQKRIVGLLVATALLAAVFYFNLPTLSRDLLKRALDWIAGMGVWAAALFAFVVVATIGLWMTSRMTGLSASAPPMSIAVLPLRLSADIGDGTVLSRRLTQDVITVFLRAISKSSRRHTAGYSAAV